MTDPLPIFLIPIQTPMNIIIHVICFLEYIIEHWNLFQYYFYIPLIVSLLYYIIMQSPRLRREEGEEEEYFGPIFKVAEYTQPGFSLGFIVLFSLITFFS